MDLLLANFLDFRSVIRKDSGRGHERKSAFSVACSAMIIGWDYVREMERREEIEMRHSLIGFGQSLDCGTTRNHQL